ncbi:DUF262 domain-containing protein [Micromonospora sp. WMMD736]|uniref:DUF262 domain-containing protein n=1 Tax=Micromonospora sp. WMMD736 TaxID=3404112 RepID=UPI003B934605
MTDEEIMTDLRPVLVGNIAGEFFVPSYQRGYRWGRDEVVRLLNDVHESAGKKYFLQPVVVKRRHDGKWELVDGQQRLTTLLLILLYIRQHLPTATLKYELEYETRPASAKYLQHPTFEESRDNIDFFHIFGAFECIREWFDARGNPTLEAINFYKYFSESVYVIWYEAPPKVESTTLFTRLNIGRIPLTDAELVKALVLARSRTLKRDHEIAAQWDSIERDLRIPEVWAFVTGRSSLEATHITLLLDTLAGEPKSGPRPLFHTFETLRAQIEVNDAQDLWDQVIDLHSLVMGWYDSRDLFHKIGYLIARGRRFADLVTLSQDCTKHEFEARLDARIRDDLNLRPSDIAELRYGNRKAEAVLLLMNVETVRRMQLSSERFSFREHAARRWSIEHIHAQNAEQLNRAVQWREWLRLHRDALASLPTIEEMQRADLTTRIDAAMANVSAEVFVPLEQEVSALFSRAGEGEDINVISNLALLSNGDNSALSNSVFEVKRRHVLERDRAGSYIPVCTRNVFLKYYTEAEGQQIHFWGTHDREGYLAAMTEHIAPYLLKEDAL